MADRPTGGIVVSIATMNSRDDLRRCLESLPAAAGRRSLRVVVIDNCSADGTAEMLRDEFADFDVITNPTPRGFGANHNQVMLAAARAGADHVLILNDDTILKPGAIARLADAAERDPTTGAVVPLVLGPDGVEQPTALRALSFAAILTNIVVNRPRPRTDPDRADWVNGCCVLIPGSVIRHVGGFDERFFMYSEDADLSVRMRRLGYRLWQDRSAQILHVGGATSGQPAHADRMTRQMWRSAYLLDEKAYGRRVAAARWATVRLAFITRATIVVTAGVYRRDATRIAAARRLVDLARFDPRTAVFPESG